MANTPAKLPIFNWGTRRRLWLWGAALAAPFVMCAPAAKPTLTVPAYADSFQHPTGFADVVKKVRPAVIAVRAKIDAGAATADDGASDESPLERFLRRFGVPEENDRSSVQPRRTVITSQGSGFFISADGYAVTNGHVVENARTIEVTTDDGKTHSARVIGNDARSDLALVKVDGDHFPFVSFSDAIPQIGDWVLAVGNPFGLGGTVTAGIISAQGRDIGAGNYDDFIQIDAPVNRGNSGGPAFDVEGNVIGVTTAIVSPSGGSVGIGFAIPAETVKAVIAQLREKGVVTRGWIGVQIQPVTEDIANSLGLKEALGALVAEPQADGPAAKAGIEAGDVITAVNGKDISDDRDLARTISGMSPGAAVHITVMRKGQEKIFSMTAGTLPDQHVAGAVPEAPRQSGYNVPELGISVSPQHGRNGIAVTKVDPDGSAADLGVTNGDVILEAAGRKVATATELRNAIDGSQKSGRHSVLLRLKSGKTTKFVAVPAGHG